MPGTMVGYVHPALPWWVMYTPLFHGGWYSTRASWEGGTVPGHHGGIVHPVYAPWLPWWVYTLPTMPSYPTLGIPTIPPYSLLSVQHLPLTLRCQTVRPWAQKRRNPWVGGEKSLKVLKGVREGGRTLRIVTRFFPGELEERLDSERVILHVSPMVREVYAMWSIRCPSDRCCSCVHPSAQSSHLFSQECQKGVLPWGYSRVCRRCCSLLKPLRRVLTAHHTRSVQNGENHSQY